MNELELRLNRPDPRRFAALIVIVAATGIALGHTLRQPTQMGANDISRWCTVWSLLERGTYAIDDCPWQIETQDKVLHGNNGGRRPRAGQALLFEQAGAVTDSDRGDALPGADSDRRATRPGCAPGSIRALDSETRPRLSQ